MALRPGILNRIPPALLSMLQLKQRGENPDTLSDTVVPTIDVSHWYDAEAPRGFIGTTELVSAEIYAGNVLFNISQVRVPQDEIWWLRSFSVRAFGETATMTDFWVQQLSPLILVQTLAQGNDGVIASGYCSIVGESAPYDRDGFPALPTIGGDFAVSPSMRDIWVPPGSTFGAVFAGSITDTGGTQGIQGQILADCFKI